MSVVTPPIARTLDNLTPDWLNTVLDDAGRLGSSAVVALDSEAIGTGQMSRVLRLTPTYSSDSENAPGSLIVKVASEDSSARAAGHAMGFYEAEVRFYREIAPQVTAATPPCIAGAIDVTDGAFTLLLEDQPELRVGDMVTGGTVDDAALALAELAKLQAPLWNSPALSTTTWLSPARWRMFSETFPSALQPFLDRFADALGADEIALCEQVIPQAVPWLDAWSGPTVVQHGDYRLDNMLFGEAPSRIVVFDWQTARVGPPLVDAGFYLGGCLSIEERRAHEQELLRGYHKRLQALGVTTYSWDDCLRDYARYAVYGLLGFVGTFIHVEVNPRGEELYLAAFHRYAQQALDLTS
ncbi:phosphotransferase [Mycobacterium sp.]|uniref:phosphotransferase n=1 Tax=Mycobacterium sp. TaxID=1785 RepID=UPI00121DB52E|nr:phosphotransferase [Mycobacterium sp.]TAM62835.1 MAG: DUF1679 domain-containing protein [Mycobacterium sp.]